MVEVVDGPGVCGNCCKDGGGILDAIDAGGKDGVVCHGLQMEGLEAAGWQMEKWLGAEQVSQMHLQWY